jgi:peroxiredoxin
MKIYNKTLNSVLIVLSVFLSMSQANAQSKTYTINGTLKEFSQMPKKIYMLNNLIIPGTPQKIDSADVVNGGYRFTGSTDISVSVNIGLSKQVGSEVFALMLDQGDLDLVSTGKFLNTTVSGSGAKAQNELSEITSFAKKESIEINRLSQLPEYKSNDSLQTVLRNRSTNLLGNALVNMISYIRKNPKSSISPFLTYSLLASGYLTPLMADTLTLALPEAIKTTSVGKAIDALGKKNTKEVLEAAAKAEAKRKEFALKNPIGSKAIAFTMNDVAGKSVSLASFKGKYVLIDFWASWCKPCRAENPNLVKAYAKYKSKGFDILGVSIDGAGQKAAWIKAIKDDGMGWVQVSDLKGASNEAAVLYGVESIPQNFLLDPNGIIVAKNLRGTALEEKLAEIFK